MRIKTAAKKIQANGFSLVEAIVSVFIFFTAVAISMSLFTFSMKNTGRVENDQRQANAIDADAANIHRINQQFSCTTGTSCGVATSSGSYPDEDSYAPDSYAETAATRAWFEPLCTNGFGDDLAEYVNTLDQSNLSALGIVRNAAQSNSSDAPHEYTVTWTEAGITLNQITLLPTVAAWCP